MWQSLFLPSTPYSHQPATMDTLHSISNALSQELLAWWYHFVSYNLAYNHSFWIGGSFSPSTVCLLDSWNIWFEPGLLVITGNCTSRGCKAFFAQVSPQKCQVGDYYLSKQSNALLPSIKGPIRVNSWLCYLAVSQKMWETSTWAFETSLLVSLLYLNHWKLYHLLFPQS
jgi:hypothetical protein